MSAAIIALRHVHDSRLARLAWFAAAIFVIVFGIGEFARWVIADIAGDSWWGTDLQLIVHAGVRMAAGQSPYVEPRFLYPPLAALLGVPAGTIPFLGLSVAYAVFKVAITLLCVFLVMGRYAAAVRILAATTLVFSLPYLHDIMLGNANVLLVASMVPAVLGRNRYRDGVALGLACAVFAKPLLVPVLLWLLIWRPRAFVGSAATAGGLTLIGMALVGFGHYVAWLETLSGGTRYAAPFAGNHGVSAVLPDLWVPIAVLGALGLVLVLLLRGPNTTLIWALTVGILIAPYAGTYSALPIALAMPSLATFTPMAAIVVVAISPAATTHPLPGYAAAILLVALLITEPARPLLGRFAAHRAAEHPT